METHAKATTALPSSCSKLTPFCSVPGARTVLPTGLGMVRGSIPLFEGLRRSPLTRGDDPEMGRLIPGSVAHSEQDEKPRCSWRPIEMSASRLADLRRQFPRFFDRPVYLVEYLSVSASSAQARSVAQFIVLLPRSSMVPNAMSRSRVHVDSLSRSRRRASSGGATGRRSLDQAPLR
jgi:hypothetical protein